MSSGESCILSHPEMIFVTAMTLVLAVPEPTHPEGERIASCSYPQIAHVETYRPVRAA
ncbi:MAG: hypothetical protein JWO31_3800 [Phycisphaerales bacterium]|nr:hypothetical protein [Phycisphaerales bacterium]